MLAKPEFNVRQLLRIIDTHALGVTWKTLYPDLLDRLSHFRKEMGDTCNYTKGCLTVLWANEVERDADGFFSALRAAGYK